MGPTPALARLLSPPPSCETSLPNSTAGGPTAHASRRIPSLSTRSLATPQLAFAKSPHLPCRPRCLIRCRPGRRPPCSGYAVPGDEDVFPQDSLPTGKTLGPLDATAATNWLWRAGTIPEWIDVRAYDASSSAS